LVSRVLVTGGAGFIGSHVVDGLVSEGFAVVVLDDFSGGRENLSQHFGKFVFCLIEGDIRDEVDVRKALDVVDACPRVTEKRKGL
jgi:UDP-glucose 4-epimerase